jgi:glycosyltransferase involved in cell wall biosynthesis
VPQMLSTTFHRGGPPIVHRLDGVGELVRGHRTDADDLQRDINQLTDHTIFQSVYCRESFASVGVTPVSFDVINNGVDGSIFYPAERKRFGPVLRLIGSSWSPNPRKGFSTLAALSLLPDVEVRFAGRWPEQVASQRVILLGPQPSESLAEALRGADAMVHAAENEPCSNAILEALACGLPVLYRDSGGNRELAGDFGLAIGDDLEAAAHRFRSSLETFRARVLEAREQFLIETAAVRYLAVFEKIAEQRA